MTKTLTLRNFDFPAIHKFGIGFDNLFDDLMRVGSLQSNSNYPPHNVIKTGENQFQLELAVAGFAKTDLEITLDGGKLTIAGKTKDASDMDNANAYYFYKGIAERAFTRTFTLADSVEIKNAEMVNGILKVWLENFIPEHKKPKKIDIKD